MKQRTVHRTAYRRAYSHRPFYCEVCGQMSNDTPSRIMLQANYGSRYDGASVKLEVCGQCIDSVFNTLFTDDAEEN